MRLFYILLVLSTLSFLSCQKDHISEIDGGTYIEPSDQNDPHVVTGIITSENGEKMNDVSIKIYQEGELVGEVTSDVNGYYSTDGMPLDPSKQFTLEYFKPNFNYKYRRVEELKVNRLDKSVVISPVDNDPSIRLEKLSDPSDTSYVKVYGYCKFSSGNPIKNVKIDGAWEFWTIGDRDYPLIEFSDRTGSDGYFEGLVPKGQEILLFDWYERFPSQYRDACYIEIIDNEKYTLSGIPFFETSLGILHENHEVFTKMIEEDTYKIDVRGRALSCDGLPLSNITIKSYLIANFSSGLPGISHENYQLEADGSFHLEYWTCDKEIPLEDLRVNVFINDIESSFSTSITVDYQNNLDVGDLYACNDHNTYDGSINLEIEGFESLDSLTVYDGFSTGKDSLIIGFSGIDGDNGSEYSGGIYLDNIALGIVSVSKFTLYNFGGPYETINNDGNGIIVEITEIDGNDYVTGIISGTVIVEGEERTINGDFYVYNK